MRKVSTGLCVAMFVAGAMPAIGAIILPEDDVTYRSSNRYNNTNVFGLFTKGGGTTDRAYVEFLLDATPVTSATLKLYNYWGAPQGKTVNCDVRIRAISENEAGYVQWTDTAGPAPSGTSHESWTIVADLFNVNSTPAWYNFDITSLYNANLGKRVTFSIRAVTTYGTADGPIFEDKENTGLSGNPPQIDWVPEPAGLMLLGVGSLLLARRRR